MLRNFTQIKNYGTMETETISINGASSKSHTSRGNNFNLYKK